MMGCVMKQIRRLVCFAIILFCLPPTTAAPQAGGPSFQVLNWQRLETRGEFQGMRLFMNLLRNDPALQNDESVLKHFMAANNCDDAAAFQKELNNEFDYPKMAAFYRAKMPEILKGAPSSIHVMLTGFLLGQYDSAKGVFPFVRKQS